MGGATIRKLSTIDAGSYLVLRRSALIEAPLAFSNTPDQEAHVSTEDVRKKWADGFDWTMGAFIDEELVGISNFERERAPRFNHKGMIWGFYVRPENRRGGLGRAMLLATMREAFLDPELRQINLGVNAINDGAKALYESCGFLSFAYERAYMRVDGVLYDEYWMVCDRTRFERCGESER